MSLHAVLHASVSLLKVLPSLPITKNWKEAHILSKRHRLFFCILLLLSEFLRDSHARKFVARMSDRIRKKASQRRVSVVSSEKMLQFESSE